MTGLDIGIVIGYFLVIIAVGVYSSRKAQASSDYLVAGHRLGYGITFACLSAVLLGGASTIGSTALGYRYGISGIWLVSMLGLGLMLVGILLVKRIRELEVLTVAELLTKRFGAKAGVVTALVSALYTMMVCATQVIAMGTILQGFAGWDSAMSMLVVGVVVVAYTILGGMWAITLTDFIQFILIVAGVTLVMMPACVHAAGGLSAIGATLPSSYFDITSIGFPTIVQYFFLYCLGALVGQDLWQRYLTARSVKVARRSGIASGAFILFYAIACTLVGMAAAVYMPGIDDAQLVFAKMADEVLPTGALGLVLTAVLAVLMSTASGTLMASSSLLTNDVIKPASAYLRTKSKAVAKEYLEEDRMLLKASRRMTACVGAVAIVVAVWLNNVIAALDASYAILSGALFFPIILGMFWKKATAKAALASIVVSSVVILLGLGLMGTTAVEPIMIGLAVSGAIMVSVSLLGSRIKDVDINKDDL